MALIDSGPAAWQPNFSLSVEGSDITDVVRENLVDLTLKDYGGSSKKSDEISLTVVSPDLKLPAKGVKISIAMGFGGNLVNKGTFVVDARSSGGSSSQSRTVQIVARAFSKTNERGHSTLQSQKTRSFTGITLGDLISTVASEHGLAPKIDSTLQSISIKHIDQLGESDMNLMTRVAEQYGAVSKITHDNWVLSPRDSDTTVSGHPLPVRTITPSMCDSWRYHDNSDHPDCSNKGSGTMVIPYRDMANGGQIKTLTVGSGEPVMHFAFPQPSLQDAQYVAGGGAKKAKKKLKGVSLSMPATPELMPMSAEGKITMDGFGSVEDGDWKIEQVEFKLSTQGFAVNIELE